MSEQKHFSYKGSIDVDPNKQPIWGKMGEWTVYKQGDFPPNSEVTDVRFMAPARVSYESENGNTGGNAIVFVDLINKKVFNGSGEVESEFSEKIFDSINKSMKMPENMYATTDVGEEYEDVSKQHEEMLRSNDLSGDNL